MADTIRGYGRIVSGESFEFSLDGLSTSAQMERLIKLTSETLKTLDSTKTGLADELEKTTKNLKDFQSAIREEKEKNVKNLEDLDDRASRTLEHLFYGNIRGALTVLDSNSAKFALGLSTLVGALTGYADKLGEGLQRGIAGNIFDYAVMAKTAGVNIEQFSKAIGESGGAFSSLGDGATNGAKQFAALAGEVRLATASVGNLGMTNAQILEFTARQTKVAISQGFKGRQAQELVIRNSRALAEELDILANRTGKSVLEMAQAAMKLAQDPIVSNFVQTARQNGAEISKSVQQFGASLRGVFGELGDTLSADALRSAMGGLPFVITQTGKNLLMSSSSVYSEIERQAQKARLGQAITSADQQKLRDTIIAEVEARGDELRMMANLEGPVGDSARQLLELAKQANFYNSEAGAQRREEEKRAQEFNAELRKFQANLQALAIPFLQLINTIDWGAFVAVLNAAVITVKGLLTPFQKFGELLGMSNLPGTVLGGLLGLIAIGGLVATTFSTVSMLSRAVSSRFAKLAEEAWVLAGAFEVAARRMAAGKNPLPGYIGGGRDVRGSRAAMAAAGVATVGGAVGAYQTGGVGGVVGEVAGSAGGYFLGAMAGRALGGALGSVVPVVGTIIGGILGGWLGGLAGEAIGGNKSAGSELNGIGADTISESQRQAQINSDALQNMDKTLTAMLDQNSVSNGIASYGNRIASDQVRATTNLGLRMG